MHNYLGPDFKGVLYSEAEKFWQLESGGGLFSISELAAMRGDDDEPVPLPETGDLEIDENRRKVQNSIRLDVRTVNVEIPKDVHFQNEEQVLRVDQAKFARTANEIDRVFMAYINTKGGQFESRQGDRTNRIAGYLLGVLEDYFNIYDTDAKKVVLYHDNNPKFDRLLDLALERYLRQRQQAKPASKRIMTDYTWEVPEERIYDGDTHKIEPDAHNHALNPFVELNGASAPEKRFVAFLERHTDKIDWWYKNGDNGRMHYAIPFNDGNEESLFYPDFVIRMKSGRIYIFDTKSRGSDILAPAKHNALRAYMQLRNSEGQNLHGGILIETTPDCWLYCKLDISDTDDLRDWDMFDPNNA